MAGSAFFQAFMTSLSVIAASEVGDKTFFIAAVMAMKNSRWVVRIVLCVHMNKMKGERQLG